MIGRIAGRVLYRGTDHILVDVGGVGYLVYGSERTLAMVPGPGEAVALFTDLLVREDNLQLFGFHTLQEKEWHRMLVGVQGIGAKAALAIQGALGADGISRAIAMGDWGAVAQAKGVGPKIAQRVVSELKDKVPEVMAMVSPPTASMAAYGVVEDDENSAQVSVSPSPPKRYADPTNTDLKASTSTQADALSALANLGYSPTDAASAVAQALNASPGADTATLIREALRLLAPKG